MSLKRFNLLAITDMRVSFYVQYDKYWRGLPAVLISFNLGVHDGSDDAPVVNICLSAGALEGQGDRWMLWSQTISRHPCSCWSFQSNWRCPSTGYMLNPHCQLLWNSKAWFENGSPTQVLKEIKHRDPTYLIWIRKRLYFVSAPKVLLYLRMLLDQGQTVKL